MGQGYDAVGAQIDTEGCEVATVVKMPKWGLTMEEGLILEWKVSKGDRVENGDVIAVVESEKVEIEFPSPSAGLVAELLVDVEDEVPVGAPVAVLVADEEELEAYEPRRG